MKPKITLYLDTRRKKKSGLFPIKIRVWDPMSGDAKFFRTGFDLSEKDFASSWESIKPRGEYREIRDQLEELRFRVVEICNQSKGNLFDALNRKLYRPSGAGQNIFYHYDETIDKLTSEERIGTASSYSLAQKSLKRFLVCQKRSVDLLRFDAVDKNWLESFESHMVRIGRSKTTVGIYLRTLRAIFNTAVDLNEIDKSLYPFGKRKYVIPSGRKVKKALKKEDLASLFLAEPATVKQAKARDFFFFSYACNGMNIKDIALLKFSDINEDSFTFFRAKSFRTTKERSTPITVYLNDFSHMVLSKYGNEPLQSPYAFPILTSKDDALTKHRKVQAFTRFVNQHVKKLCTLCGVPNDISSIWARHSFTTGSVNQGQSLEFMQEALGHTDIKTTQNYFAGFENEAKRAHAKNLMNFT